MSTSILDLTVSLLFDADHSASFKPQPNNIYYMLPGSARHYLEAADVVDQLSASLFKAVETHDVRIRMPSGRISLSSHYVPKRYIDGWSQHRIDSYLCNDWINPIRCCRGLLSLRWYVWGDLYYDAVGNRCSLSTTIRNSSPQ